MADSFFGFDTSLSNLNDDEGGGEPSEDEYDALNNETFGDGTEEFDWEVQHEHLAEQMESSRRHNSSIDDAANHQLEASLSQLVLDEPMSTSRSFLGSSVWRPDPPAFPTAPTPNIKNVCTVEELERQLRQKQLSQPQQQTFNNQNYFQPRFPPVILQRPPGLQAPVPLPFAPQQPMTHTMNQPMNNIIGQNSQTQLMQNHLGQNVNQLAPNINQLGQNVNQHNQNVNQHGPNVNQLGPNVNQLGPNVNQLAQNMNQMGQNMNQFMQNSNQLGNQFQNNQMGQGNLMNPLSQNMQNVHQMGQSNQLVQNQMGQNMNPIGQNVNNINQLGQNVNPLGQNMNQLGHNVNQMGQNQILPNGNQFGPNMNQYSQMLGQPPRMIAPPPPGINMPRQNFSPNMGQFNPNFRGPSMPTKPTLDQQQPPMNQQQPPMNQQQPTMNQQQPTMNQQQPPMNQQQPTMNQQQPTMNQQQQNMLMNQQLLQQMKNQSPQINQNVLKPTMNQSPQNQNVQLNQQPKNQNQKNRIEPKMQKNRVYNNSQKNLTSQNLVQIIQNTHPMLNQFNNSYHNASHHPMLNNRNNLYNSNNQFVNNHPMFNNQRSNESFVGNNRQMTNGDDSSIDSDTDEYVGLMTQREKQWLINIQMLQLNTGTPYIHDYYYTVFLERQADKEKESVKEAHKANQQNHPFYSGSVKQETHSHPHGRERHNSGRHNSTSEDAPPRTYVPTQFENSLGKLQCGSVTAPRKIIDVELVSGEPASARASRAPSVASTTNPAEVPREVRRTKQLLLDIEALYMILLRLEEMNEPLAISNALILKEREEKQRLQEALQKETEAELEEDSNLFLRNIESVQRRPKQESPKAEGVDKRQVVNLATSQKPPVKNLLDEDREDLISRLFNGLLYGDRLPHILTVRKGRALVHRFVQRMPASPHPRLRAFWARVLRALPSVARRDDGGLAALAPFYKKFIQSSTGWPAITESCTLLSETLDPARTPYVLTSALTLSCVCALTEKAAVLVNTPEATSNERHWTKFLKTLARALKNTTLNVARPVTPIQKTMLMNHLKHLESRNTIEILQRGKTAAEFADLSKHDVTEQLVKHLC